MPPSQPCWVGLPFSFKILPPMRDAETELVERYVSAVGSGDIAAAAALITDDVRVDTRDSNAPWGGQATLGKGEFRAAFETFHAQWSEIGGVGWELLQVQPAGGGRLAIETRISGRGPITGIDLDARGGWLISFRDGLISECVLHQSLVEALLAGRRRAFGDARLYFVCDARPQGKDPAPLLDAALAGGVDVIQLRDKDLSGEELVEAARPFRAAAAGHRALFILNDRPELVAAADADGVHVGQDDAPVDEARRAAEPAAVVGLSTHTSAEVDAAFAAHGAARPDQVSVGPVWETPTKEGRPATGLELISHAAEAGADLPWFAIGGIDAANIAEVVAAGARRIVVVRAIRDAADPEASARELRAALTAAD